MIATAPPRRRVAAALVLCGALAACGNAGSAAVPGVAMPSEQMGSTIVADPEADAASASTVPAIPTTTIVALSPEVETSQPETSIAPAVASARILVPTPVIAPVSGWPAFDLHLQTILTSGSDAVSATVLLDGEIVHQVALGQRTTAGDPVGTGDRFRVASISKVITAITVLRLVQAGQIDLDAPVGGRLAEIVGTTPSAGVTDITPRHLLTHRSGIGQYEDLMFRHQVESCPQAAAVGLGRSLERAPGTTFRYSNLNFCLLGLLIEDVTGRPYGDVVRDELLTPLGIDDMRLAGTFDVRDGDVEHRSDEGRNYMEVLGAAGAWIASPTDIATIVDSLDLTTPGWKPLDVDVLAAMTTITVDPPHVPEPGVVSDGEVATTAAASPPTSGYGMGLMIFGPDTWGHTGTVESTHAMTVRRPDGYTWAITVSGDHPSSTRDLAGIVAVALRYAGVTGP